MPFPVVAGFLGMVGSSILRSAFVVNAGSPMSHPSDLLAFAISQPFELAACVALGLSLVLAKRLPVPNRVLLVAAIGTTLLGFYASKHALGVEARWLREQGWLFEKKAAEPFWSVWSKHALGRVHWLRTFPTSPFTSPTSPPHLPYISLHLRCTRCTGCAPSRASPTRWARAPSSPSPSCYASPPWTSTCCLGAIGRGNWVGQ